MIWFKLKLLVTMVAARFGAARDEDNEEGISVFRFLGRFGCLWVFMADTGHTGALGKTCKGSMRGGAFVNSWPRFSLSS